MLEFTCPGCKGSVQGDDSLAGKLVLCPVCKTTMTAPMPGEPAPSPAQAEFSTAICKAPHRARPDERYQLYLNWNRLPAWFLHSQARSIFQFLYWLFKRMYGIPIGYTAYDFDSFQDAVVPRSGLTPGLLAEAERVRSQCFEEGFTEQAYFRLVLQEAIALLSADGKVGLLIGCQQDLPDYFFCSCTSILADGRRCISWQKMHYLQFPPSWVVSRADGAQPEDVVRRHREALAGHDVVAYDPAEVSDWVIALQIELVQYNIDIGVLYYAEVDDER